MPWTKCDAFSLKALRFGAPALGAQLSVRTGIPASTEVRESDRAAASDRHDERQRLSISAR
jgi:hypothetical protein